MRTHSLHVAASTHLLIGEVRAEHKNERFADSLTACSGIDSQVRRDIKIRGGGAPTHSPRTAALAHLLEER